MDGEKIGKPYFLMDDLGGNTPFFGAILARLLEVDASACPFVWSSVGFGYGSALMLVSWEIGWWEPFY